MKEEAAEWTDFFNRMFDEVKRIIYEQNKLDPFKGTPSEAFDARQKYYSDPKPGMKPDFKWFTTDKKYWESALIKIKYKNKKIVEIIIYPVELGMEKPRSQRGRPMLASQSLATKILEKIAQLSEPYGTEIKIENGLGKISL